MAHDVVVVCSMTDVSSPPEPLITADPGRMSGVPCFTGTRVPVKSLFDFLEDGAPLDEFLAAFPNVTRAHAVAVLRAGEESVFAYLKDEPAYSASPEELDAIDEARAQVRSGQRATADEVAAVLARFG